MGVSVWTWGIPLWNLGRFWSNALSKMGRKWGDPNKATGVSHFFCIEKSCLFHMFYWNQKNRWRKKWCINMAQHLVVLPLPPKMVMVPICICNIYIYASSVYIIYLYTYVGMCMCKCIHVYVHVYVSLPTRPYGGGTWTRDTGPW